VDDDQASRAVLVRVGILLAGSAMGRPARVSDTPAPHEWIGAQRLFEVPELAGGPPPQQLSVAHDSDPGRVIAAILEPAQALDDDLHR
jgi:hypothetical protein